MYRLLFERRFAGTASDGLAVEDEEKILGLLFRLLLVVLKRWMLPEREKRDVDEPISLGVGENSRGSESFAAGAVAST